MEKPAQTQFPIHELLEKRWSPRAFDERSVEADKLLSLFEAARWARWTWLMEAANLFPRCTLALLNTP